MRTPRAALLAVALAMVVVLALPASAHRDNGGHPGVSMAVTSATLLGNGHVHAVGTATCPPGEDWGVGFHIYEAARDRSLGMASLSNPVLPVVCDGTPQAWEADSADVYAGGAVTAGEKNWGGKMQSPSVGAWIHKDAGYNGVATVS